MRLMRPQSLQGRLLALVLGLVVGIWSLGALLTWLDARHELDELLDGHLAQAAALLVVQQAGDYEDEPEGVDAPQLHRYAPKVAFQVFHEGRLSMRSSNAPAQPLLDPSGPVIDGFRTLRVGDTRWRVFATHGRERDVRVFVGEQVESRDAILWALLRSALTPLVLALPLLGLALWWAVRRGMAPLRLLGRVLAQRSPQALQPVQLDKAPAEMVPMIEALNGLFARISTLLESERRFTADAAHELRTPIAAIRAQAQVALGAMDNAERQHALQATLQGCDRAARLVEQMLTLARLEALQAGATQTVDLKALCQQLLAEAAPLALERQQQLALDADAHAATPLRVRGEPALLTVMVRNLVDNACRYSPPGARVELRLRREAESVLLDVEDSGPGLQADEQARLGERFFRVLGSGQPGSGLGWSIVRRIAAVHQATLAVDRSPQLGGLRVQLRLNAADTGAPGKRAEDQSSDTPPRPRA